MTTPINAIDSTTSAGSVQTVRHHRAESMAKIADKLGMSSDDLKKELGSGKSLNDVATEKGVSHDDLVAAIKQGGTMSDAQAEKIASKTGTAEAHGHHGGGHRGGGVEPKGENAGLRDDDKLGQVSQLLDMSASDVSGTATSASSLVGLLKSKGVDLSSLKSVLDNGDLLDVTA